MSRYGFDYGRWGGGERYDREQSFQGRDRGYNPAMGYGGMRSDGWGSNWRNYPGESGWFGEASPGYQSGFYDSGYRGSYGQGVEGEGMRYDQGMQGGNFGVGYGGRDSGHGGFDYERAGRHGGSRNWSDQGSWGRGRDRGSMRAAELMTVNPECVTPDTTLTDVAKKMRELDVGIIPVVDSMESRRLQGVITDRDIAIRAVADGKAGKTRVSECMTSNVDTVNKNDDVREVLNIMEREQVRRVPVTDRDGRLVGIIAQADLLVDFTRDNSRRELMVEDTIERISEPAHPRRAAMAAQGRQEGMSGELGASAPNRGQSQRPNEG
jgi:CBS domain-containing protein